MKEKIKKFWNEHETVQIVCGAITGAAFVLVPLAIQAKGAQVTSADHLVRDDGKEVLVIRQRNGKITSLKKRTTPEEI